MNYLKTYRNYLLFNKISDLLIYLIVFTLITTFSFMIYYTTKSFFILCVVILVIYIIGLLISKLFETKILLPSIVYLVVSLTLISLVCYFERESMNSKMIEFALNLTTSLAIITLMITLYKYETPISIYYKIKDYFSGIKYGKKIKTKYPKIKKHNSITPYSTNLLFERIKLVHKLNEEYKYEYNILENKYTKEYENLKSETEELNDLEEQLEIINKRLKKKHTGAQDYELCNQKKELKEKLKNQREKTAEITVKVNTLLNSKEELTNTHEKNKYYILNAYNMRYINYTNAIKEKLSLTKYFLEIVPFDSIIKNLEGENEKFVK